MPNSALLWVLARVTALPKAEWRFQAGEVMLRWQEDDFWLRRDAVKVFCCELAPQLHRRLQQPLCFQGGWGEATAFLLSPATKLLPIWGGQWHEDSLGGYSPTAEQHVWVTWKSYSPSSQAWWGLHILNQWSSCYGYVYTDHKNCWPCQADTGEPSGDISRHLSNFIRTLIPMSFEPSVSDQRA